MALGSWSTVYTGIHENMETDTHVCQGDTRSYVSEHKCTCTFLSLSRPLIFIIQVKYETCA